MRKGPTRVFLLLLCVSAGSLACLCLGEEIVPWPLAGRGTASPKSALASAPAATPTPPLSPTQSGQPSLPTSIPLPTFALSATPTPTPTRRPTRVPSATPIPTPTQIPDTQGPQIVVVGADPNPVKVNDFTTVTAKINDPCGIFREYVMYRYDYQDFPKGVGMIEIEDGVYERKIPWPEDGFPSPGTVIYYIWAEDNCFNSTTSETWEITVQ
jgi:hypothetical protein